METTIIIIVSIVFGMTILFLLLRNSTILAQSRLQNTHLQKQLADISEANRRFEQEIKERTNMMLATNKVLEELNSELVEGEAMSRLLVNNLLEAIVIHDSCKILEANTSFVEMIGRSEESLLGKSFLDFVPTEYKEPLQKTLCHEQDYPVEVEIYDFNGNRFYVELLNKFFYYKSKPAFVVAIRNIDKRRKAEKQLRDSEERLRALYSSASVGFCIIGLNGDITFANSSLCFMTGYTEAELRRINYFNLIHHNDIPECKTKMQELVNTRKPSQQIVRRILRKDGTYYWASISPVPSINANG